MEFVNKWAKHIALVGGYEDFRLEFVKVLIHERKLEREACAQIVADTKIHISLYGTHESTWGCETIADRIRGRDLR